MTQADLLKLSRHGDPKAISQLINRAVQPLKITVKVSIEGRRLIVFAEGQEAPNQRSLVRIIQRGIVDLDTEAIDTFKVYGRKTGNSVSSWTQEVVLRLAQVVEPPIKATKTKETSALLPIPTQQITDLLGTLFKRILNVRIRKKLITWFLASVLFVLAATGSVVGFKLFRSRSLQAETVTKAQTLISQAGNISKAPNLDSLKASELKLKQAEILFASVPNTPGGLYSQAQSELTKIHSQLDEIKQRSKVEEEAAATFESQNRIAQVAIESVKKPPHSLEVWQQAKTNLEQANTSLSSIPKETFIYQQVKVKSPGYKKSYAAITQALNRPPA